MRIKIGKVYLATQASMPEMFWRFQIVARQGRYFVGVVNEPLRSESAAGYVAQTFTEDGKAAGWPGDPHHFQLYAESKRKPIWS